MAIYKGGQPVPPGRYQSLRDRHSVVTVAGVGGHMEKLPGSFRDQYKKIG